MVHIEKIQETEVQDIYKLKLHQHQNGYLKLIVNKFTVVHWIPLFGPNKDTMMKLKGISKCYKMKKDDKHGGIILPKDDYILDKEHIRLVSPSYYSIKIETRFSNASGAGGFIEGDIQKINELQKSINNILSSY